MSYGITACITSFFTVEMMCGSESPVVLQETGLRAAQKIQSFHKEEPEAIDIVADLIKGQTRFEDHGHLYHYAFVFFCEDIGKTLRSSAWMPNKKGGDFLQDSAFWNKFPIEMPPCFEGHPVIACIKFEELDEFKKEVTDYNLDKDERDELNGWIESARSEEMDLVLTYH